MKKIIIESLLYFYTMYIVEDWSQFKPFGKIIIYPFWFIRSLIFWVFLPLFIIEYLIINSDFYKKLQKQMNEFDFNF